MTTPKTYKLVYYLKVHRNGKRTIKLGPFPTEQAARETRKDTDYKDFNYSIIEYGREVSDKPARARHVYSTSEIPHLWAHQTQTDARNGRGNLFFNGPTIYSYRQSWPLARIYNKRGKSPLVLVNSSRYGVTTTRHQSNVNYAAGHMAQIACPNPAPSDSWDKDLTKKDHIDNLEYFEKEIARYLDESTRSLQVRNVERRQKAAKGLYKDMADYKAFFGLRGMMPPPPDFTAQLKRAKSIERPNPVRDAKRYKAKQAREALALRKDAEKAEMWRQGNNAYNIWGYHGSRRNLLVYLRVAGDDVETNKGARFPVSHVARLWRVIRGVMQSGKPYEHNGHTEHAGNYRIDKIDVDGSVHAGCHHIKFDEIQRLATTLGLS